MTLPTHAPQALLILLIVVNLALMKALRDMVKPLERSGDKCSMANFELAGNAENAERIMRAWRNAGLEETARLSIWLDFAYLLAYPLGLALACWALAGAGTGWFDQVGIYLGYTVLACIPLDARENVALLRMLRQGADDETARIAAICAGIKFSLAGLAVFYVLIGLIRLLF